MRSLSLHYIYTHSCMSIYPYFTSSLGTVLPNNQLKCKKWLGRSKIISQSWAILVYLGGQLHFIYGGIQAQVKLNRLSG